MENIKIRIPNQDVSRKVQEKVFKLGIRWGSRSSAVRIYDNIDYITIIDNDMYYGDNESSFALNKGTEVTWQDFLYKDIDINNCKINLLKIKRAQLSQLAEKLQKLGITPYGNNSLLPAYNYVGIYIKDGKTTVVGTKLYYNSISLPELSVDYILENYIEKEMEVLPEYWYIDLRNDKENIIKDWIVRTYPNFNWSFGLNYYGTHPSIQVTNCYFGGYTNETYGEEITFDQFKRLVLKQDTQSKNMDEIVLKCIKSPVRAKNITENSTYSGIYIDEEETQVDTYNEAIYFLCQNDRGSQARYNIDLFEKPTITKPIITLETLLNYLKFTDTSIKFKDKEYTLDLINIHRYLLASVAASNSCGICLLGSQGDNGGVDSLQRQINAAVYDGAWREIRELYEIQVDDEDIVFTIFSEYIKWKISPESAGFFILSTNEESLAAPLLDKMECLKTDYVTNPNSQRAIKMWIFSNNIPLAEEPEDEDDDFGF